MTLLVSFFVLISCSTKETPDFAYENWMKKENGCYVHRLELKKELYNRKAEWYGFSEKNIVEMFGEADGVQLYERSQKFLIYNIKGTKDCQNQTPDQTFMFRMNATNQLNEISLIIK